MKNDKHLCGGLERPLRLCLGFKRTSSKGNAQRGGKGTEHGESEQSRSCPDENGLMKGSAGIHKDAFPKLSSVIYRKR